MRRSSVALTALVLAAASVAGPAHAAPPAEGREAERLAEKLPSPGQIDAAGAMLLRVLDALADVKVGPVVASVDPDAAADPRRREETLGEFVGDGDPRLSEKIHRSIGKAGRGVKAATARLAILAPALERSIEAMRDSFEDALEMPPQGRD